MSEEPRRVYVGDLPLASEVFADGADPLTVMLERANAEFDGQHVERVQAIATKAADIERLKNTRRARAARRFKRALRMLTRI
jgi:hypothetical protein